MSRFVPDSAIELRATSTATSGQTPAVAVPALRTLHHATCWQVQIASTSGGAVTLVLEAATSSSGPWVAIASIALPTPSPATLQMPLSGNAIWVIAGYGASWLRINHSIAGTFSYGAWITKAVHPHGLGSRAKDGLVAL